MSLRSGTSYWLTLDRPSLAAERLQGDVSCEVAVLGGGITGALVAYRLLQAGVETVLVDKRPLGAGSTAASTGLLQYEVDNPLSELISLIGDDRAVHAYRRGRSALDELETIVAELDDPCGFSRRDSLYFASHFWHKHKLHREYECLKQSGFDVEWLDSAALSDISTISASGAIRSARDAQIDPYRFTQVLLSAAQRRGLRCYEQTEVTGIDESSSPVRLQTATGAITADRVVYATGYDSARFLDHNPGSLHCTYAVVSEPIADFAGWPNGSLIWETARPYFYARQTPDGRAMIGGEDTAFAEDHLRDGLIAAKVERLVERFGRLFPQIAFEPHCAWAGTFGESEDGLAYIGQPQGRPYAYFAIGYGGNGITFAEIASRLITDLYHGRPNADADVFRFGR